MSSCPCRKWPTGVRKVPFSANRDARSSAFFSTKALAKLSPSERTAASSRGPALAEPVALMTSAHARNAKPRPRNRPRSANVCEIFISFSLVFIFQLPSYPCLLIPLRVYLQGPPLFPPAEEPQIIRWLAPQCLRDLASQVGIAQFNDTTLIVCNPVSPHGLPVSIEPH